MKTVIHPSNEGPKSQYPCFKRFTTGPTYKRDYIVLFTSPKTGTVVAVSEDASHSIGTHSVSFAEIDFVKFQGAIEISD